jgi:hypothetical protein
MHLTEIASATKPQPDRPDSVLPIVYRSIEFDREIRSASIYLSIYIYIYNIYISINIDIRTGARGNGIVLSNPEEEDDDDRGASCML